MLTISFIYAGSVTSRVANLCDSVFASTTPGSILRTANSKHKRTHSVSFTPAAKTPKNNRNSLLLRKLSPEEGVEVLRNSPMVVLDRRSSAKKKTPMKGRRASRSK